MRGTVAKRHGHRGASQKTCQQRSERLRGLGVAPTVRGDELGLEQQLTGACQAHGGGRRCQHLGCPKAAAGGGTQHCIAHGGGKRCQEEGCTKSALGDTGAF
jgi:hypothetical protein